MLASGRSSGSVFLLVEDFAAVVGITPEVTAPLVFGSQILASFCLGSIDSRNTSLLNGQLRVAVLVHSTYRFDQRPGRFVVASLLVVVRIGRPTWRRRDSF
jgi:hypothetical protein